MTTWWLILVLATEPSVATLHVGTFTSKNSEQDAKDRCMKAGAAMQYGGWPTGPGQIDVQRMWVCAPAGDRQ
jgi:hypothetical protein